MSTQTQGYQKQERIRWYRAVDHEKKTVKEVCKIFGIPRKTYYKWRKHDFSGGTNIHKIKKEHPNTKLTRKAKDIIEEVKYKTNYGPLKMSLYLEKHHGIKVSTAPIYRYYKKKKLIRKPQKKNLWFTPMKQRLIIKKQGEGVQCDVKYVYENGIRKYQFSVFDPYTEMYHFTIFDSKKSINAVKALKNAKEYFGFNIISIQTDNGSEYRGEFHNYCETNEIPHHFTPKSSPCWNGKVERVHKTMDEEYYQNVYRVWNSPLQWLEYYNTERIHLSLGNLTPKEMLESVTPRC